MSQLVNEEILRKEISVLKIKLAESEEVVRQLNTLLLPLEWEPPIKLGLSRNEARLLGCLYKGSGEAISKDRIFYVLYAHRLEQPDPKIVDVFVCKVRKKVEPYGIIIKTAWSRGYFLDKTSFEILKSWGIDPNESEAN